MKKFIALILAAMLCMLACSAVAANLKVGVIVVGDETGIVVDADVQGTIALDLYDTMHGMTYQAYALSGAIYDPAAELTEEEKAASLGFSLISNHAFVDGNKRIGIFALMMFMKIKILF